jgi:type IV pilus modification protein PilV
MKSLPKLHDQHGVSLLEIMVGILILSTGFLGVASIQTQALKGIKWAQHRTTAILLAQSYIERIPFNNLDDNHGSSNNTVMDIDGIEYTISINVDPLGTATQKTVEVIVSYINRSIRVETIRFP